MTDQNEGMGRRRFLHRVVVAIGGVIGTLLGLPIVSYFLSPALEDNKVYAQINRLSRPKWLASPRSTSGGGGDLTAVTAASDIPVGTPVERAYAWRSKEGWMTVSGRSSVWLVRHEDGSVTAFDPHCTHLGCPYSWSNDEGLFLCPCHDGAFDIAGKVIKGPPPRALDQFRVSIEDGKVLIGELIRGEEI